MELTEAIIKRRSIRKFTDYYVTDEEIRELLEAARWAPSWANTQVWEFVVVRDKGLIERVTSTYSEKNPAKSCSLAATALIIACAKKGISGTKNGTNRTKYSNWFMFDLGMAVQNLCLRAHEMDLGSVVVGLMDHDGCKTILSVPDDYEVVVAVPIGRPVVKVKEPPPRKELTDIVYLNRFGETFKGI